MKNRKNHVTDETTSTEKTMSTTSVVNTAPITSDQEDSNGTTPVLMRRITLCRSRRTYLETDENGHTREVSAPALMLAGKYLDTWGFPIGMKLDVEISEGKILITPAAEQPYLEARKVSCGK